MGSPCEIRLYCANQKEARACYEVMLEEVKRLESKYSRYTEDSITTKINRAAGTHTAVEVDSETIALLHYAEQLYQQSDGLFDITSGVLRQAWNFKANTLPTNEAIDSLLPKVDWRLVEISENSVRLPKEGMEIDFGGYVKEFTTDTVSVKALDFGIRSGMVNLGGDIRALGPHPDGSPWRVGIQHPRIPQTPIAIVDLHQGALATSGDYERYMVVDGVRYCHLLDPQTGWSLQPEYTSVSIIAESCLIAGSFSTITLLKSQSEPDWVHESGLPHLLIDKELAPSGTIANYAPA